MNIDKVLRTRNILNEPIMIMDARQMSAYLLDFTTDDLQQVKQLWKRYAGRKSMIDFLSSEYILDKLIYYRRVTTGKRTYTRKIPYLSIKNDVIRFAAGIRREQRELTQQFIKGEIPAQDWYQQTLFLTKATLRASFTIAEGGYDTFLTDERIDRWMLMVSPVLFTYNARVEQLKEGAREIDGRLLIGADTLADSIVTTFENYRLNWSVSHGVRQARRRVYGGDTCHDHGDRRGCTELAARGWESVWKVVPIGMAACWQKCRCYLEFRYEPTDNE